MQINTLFLLRFLVILNLMFLVQSYPSMAASPEKRVALVIGNSAYQNTPHLANLRNDATEMGKVLKRIGFDVDVVVDAAKPQMDQALRRFGNNLAGSIAAVFYYAGRLGGFSDWRLPSEKELKPLVDSSGTEPTINTAYFPNTQSSWYWSSTTGASTPSNAWGVNFYHGAITAPISTLAATSALFVGGSNRLLDDLHCLNSFFS